jgi:hypothetical protein
MILNDLKKRGTNIKYLRDDTDQMVSSINKHNTFKSSSGFKNYIVDNLIKTSDNPKNHVSSYTPITFGDYDDIRKEYEESNTPKELLSLYDGHSMFKQQENNAVGKGVIGITAASGLKNYFGLIKYYSDYYDRASKINKISGLDNEFLYNEVTLGDKHFTLTRLAGLNLSNSGIELLKGYLENELLKEYSGAGLSKPTFLKKDGTQYSKDEIIDIINKLADPDVDAALTLSSILSLATDNAKELMLAKINAGVDFAGMHIYLAMMGIDTKIVAAYMTSPEALKIKSKLSRDFFTGTNMESVPVLLNKLLYGTEEKEGKIVPINANFKQYIVALKNGNTDKANKIYNDNIAN